MAAAGFDQESKNAWKKYEKCLSETEHMQDLEREENYKRTKKEKEEKAQKDTENDNKEKEGWEDDPELNGIRARDKQEFKSLLDEFNHDPEPDSGIISQIELIEHWSKKMQHIKGDPVGSTVLIAINIATAPITVPLRLIGVKPPKIKIKRPRW